MTPRNFVYLAIAAALSVLFAVVSFASNNQWSTGKAAGAKLFPTLVSDASQIATIEVRQGENAMVLERAGGSWGLKNRGTIGPIPPRCARCSSASPRPISSRAKPQAPQVRRP